MASAILRYWLCVAGLQLSLLAPVHAYSNVTQVIPQLEDLHNFPLRRNPYLGGQNTTVCCLKAVNASYQILGGQVSQTSNGFIGLDPFVLENDQFPCGAAYNGSDAGAPLVTIPYSWCRANCGGWEQSTNRVLTQWIQPFVGFILPAAVFCLNVPRKMGLAISDKLFPGRLDDIYESFNDISKSLDRIMTERSAGGSLLKEIMGFGFTISSFCILVLWTLVGMILRGGWAASIAFGDTIIWVGIVFSTSAPMILSGLYEATLDRKIVETIQNKKLTVGENRNPLLYLKIHLLYALLVGNLSLNYPEAGFEGPPSEGRFVWSDVKSLVAPFASRSEDSNIQDVDRTRVRNGTKVRLNGMLACQASFGAAIGAPVVFFLGSFFFSVFSDLSTVGDNDTSHALAFGMWWMTIPHVAIVSGCLLAGNNPNTLEVIVCGINPWDVELRQRDKRWWHYLNLYRASYDSVYQPVWMWERGRSKRNWIRRVQKEFEDEPQPGDQDREKVTTTEPRKDKYSPRNDHFKLDVKDWAFLLIVGLALMATPFLLAFLTSFYTPAIGLSCRSFTFLLYLLFQIWISVIWFWDFQHEERSRLTRQMTWASGSKITVPTFFCVVTAFGLIGSAFTAIAGTFLQILGVYRNCLCQIPMSAWSSGDYSIVISTNSQDDIHYARTFWLPTGITSIVVLILVCYIGWWYQRHWRRRFTVLVDELQVGEAHSTVDVVKKELTVNVNPVSEVNGADDPDRIVR